MTEKRKAGRPSNNASRRTEILVKASECFSRNGFNKTTLDEIGESLGFNKAALYYYFKDKEELFKNVIKMMMSELWEELKTETLAMNDLENKLLKYFEVKTKGWIKILNMNGISKENLINLNTTFSESILSFRSSEIAFLKECFNSEKTKYNDKNMTDFLNLLIDTQSDITMSAILLNDINKDAKLLEETRKIKVKVLMHFINSFHTNFIPE